MKHMKLERLVTSPGPTYQPFTTKDHPQRRADPLTNGIFMACKWVISPTYKWGTPSKFNSSPLNSDGWKTNLSFGDCFLFFKVELLNFQGVGGEILRSDRRLGNISEAMK